MIHRSYLHVRANAQRLFTAIVFAFLLLFVLISNNNPPTSFSISHGIKTQIIVITPTYRRATRLADMTRLSNTLSHIPDLSWIVIEDANLLVDVVVKLLDRSNLTYYYMAYKTQPGYPRRGWYQRDMALQFLRDKYAEITRGYQHSVVYFADDDNSYDLRLFTDYIRNVKKAGIWAVGLVGGSPVESPVVENHTVVGWHVKWHPRRKFATDMAGFAVSLDLIRKTTAKFGNSCKRGAGAPETCFLEDLGLKKEDLEPFGFDQPSSLQNNKREVLVWHTKTYKVNFDKLKADFFGFMVE